ncbi:MAG: hypothetical protein ACK44N_07595 [Bacteroidota bacterium]|jgi:hypothetical protein
MLKDINREEVEDIAIAVVPGEEDSNIWEVYMINLKEESLDNVIVASKGYGMYNGEEVKTSVLRHYLGVFEPLDIRLIEPIQKEVFGLNNEYWVSFYIGKNIYDKKFIFLPESISEDNFTRVPFINRMGVIIR